MVISSVSTVLFPFIPPTDISSPQDIGNIGKRYRRNRSTGISVTSRVLPPFLACLGLDSAPHYPGSRSSDLRVYPWADLVNKDVKI